MAGLDDLLNDNTTTTPRDPTKRLCYHCKGQYEWISLTRVRLWDHNGMRPVSFVVSLCTNCLSLYLEVERRRQVQDDETGRAHYPILKILPNEGSNRSIVPAKEHVRSEIVRNPYDDVPNRKALQYWLGKVGGPKHVRSAIQANVVASFIAKRKRVPHKAVTLRGTLVEKEKAVLNRICEETK